MSRAYIYESNNETINDYKIIIANIHENFKAPSVVPIKETKKINDNTLEFLIKEDNNKYTITKDTYFNRIFLYNLGGIQSTTNFDELTEGTKVIIYIL